jgi:hypothetical protein
MGEIINYSPKIGDGVPQRITTLPVHNPEPSTPRGRRRHDRRNESQKQAAKAAWNRERSNKMSRYQKKLLGTR